MKVAESKVRKKRRMAVGGVRLTPSGWQAVWGNGGPECTKHCSSRREAEQVACVEQLRHLSRWREWRDLPPGVTFNDTRQQFRCAPPRFARAFGRITCFSIAAHGRRDAEAKAIELAEKWIAEALAVALSEKWIATGKRASRVGEEA